TPHPPGCLLELEILPGVPHALEQLNAAGFVLVVATNQPDVARGTQIRARVDEMNQYLMDHLPLREVLTCYHDNADHCLCRKPNPGMIHEAAARHDLSIGASFMIGDRWSDIAAGAAAGCATILIAASYSKAEKCQPDYRVGSLPEAASIILSMVPSPLVLDGEDRVRGHSSRSVEEFRRSRAEMSPHFSEPGRVAPVRAEGTSSELRSDRADTARLRMRSCLRTNPSGPACRVFC